MFECSGHSPIQCDLEGLVLGSLCAGSSAKGFCGTLVRRKAGRIAMASRIKVLRRSFLTVLAQIIVW